MKMHTVVACSLLTVLFATSSFAQDAATVQAPNTTRDGVKAFRDLTYVTDGHARQKLDLYVPDNHNGDEPLPLIIWVHGGGWSAGSKDGCPPLRSGYAKRGYAVASIGYRLSGDAIFPAQIEDCKAAIRWLRAHANEYHLNPDRFAAWGSSAGGHLVALLGTSADATEFDIGEHLNQSSRVQAVCDYYGPTDLLQMDAHAIPNARLVHDSPDSPESRLIGAPLQENHALANRVNPITYITKNAPPFLIVHGDQDALVPHHQSELLYNALKSAGTPVRFHTLEGAGHGNGFGGQELQTLVREFFDRNLKDTPAKSDEPQASVTRSPAVNAANNPSQSDTSRRPNGIPWEVIRRREDTNADNRVTREEFKGPRQMFNRLDTNQDGVVTKEDFDAAVRSSIEN